MVGLLDLREVYVKRGRDFITKLLDSYVSVSENLDGSNVYIQKSDGYGNVGNGIDVFKRDDRDPLNKVDRVLMVYYENMINLFSNLDKSILNQIPSDWRFGFQYFVSTSPANIKYDQIPKNNLVITHILVKNKSNKNIKIIDDFKTLKFWADMFDIDGPPIFFTGYLREKQKAKILDYLDTPLEALKEMFGTDSFTKYFLQIINPSLKKTFLNVTTEKPIDSIVFKFQTGDGVYSAKFIDPIIMFSHAKEPKKPDDTYSIILLDILEYLTKYPEKLNVVLSKRKPDERYLEFISSIFNDYVEENASKYENIVINVPRFAKRKEFNINIDLISNNKTKKILQNDIYKNLFKIFVSSLRKLRRRSSDILTPQIIKNINGIVLKIKKITEVSEVNEFKTFKEYLSIKEQNEFLYEKEEIEYKEPFVEEVKSKIKIVDLEKKVLNKKEELKEKEKVAIVDGYFHPITKFHINYLKRVHIKAKKPIVLAIIEKSSKQRGYIKPEILKKMLDETIKNVDFICDYKMCDNSLNIKKTYEKVAEKYIPTSVYTVFQRMNGYMAEVYGNKYFNKKGFIVQNIDERDNGDIRSKMAIDTVFIDDIEGFKNFTPEYLHGIYKELKESTVTFDVETIEKLKKWHKVVKGRKKDKQHK